MTRIEHLDRCNAALIEDETFALEMTRYGCTQRRFACFRGHEVIEGIPVVASAPSTKNRSGDRTWSQEQKAAHAAKMRAVRARRRDAK